MPAAPTPLDIANTVARNLVPLGGILFLHWSAANVVVLYFVDTMLAMGVMFAGLMRYMLPPVTDEGIGARLNAEFGYVAAALFLTVFIAVPLGMPVFFILVEARASIMAMLHDEAFRAGVVLQAIAAFWSCIGLYRALKTQTPEELKLKRRFALVFLRWVAVLMITFTGFVFLFGPFAPVIVVIVYAGASIMIDVAPDKFLSVMPGGAEDVKPPPRKAAQLSGKAVPPPGNAPSQGPPSFKSRKRHKHKR